MTIDHPKKCSCDLSWTRTQVRMPRGLVLEIFFLAILQHHYGPEKPYVGELVQGSFFVGILQRNSGPQK